MTGMEGPNMEHNIIQIHRNNEQKENSVSHPTRSPCECPVIATEAVYMTEPATSLNQLEALLSISLFVEVFCSVTAGFIPRHFPFVFPFKFTSVGRLPVSSVKNMKKQLFHQIDWLIVKTVDPMTSLHVDTGILCEPWT